jgi:type IV pilus assembly protein PilQ
MSNRLRFALLAVTVTLLVTLVQLAHDCHTDLPSALGACVTRCVAALHLDDFKPTADSHETVVNATERGNQAPGAMEPRVPSAPSRATSSQPSRSDAPAARRSRDSDFRLAGADFDDLTPTRTQDHFDLIVRNKDIHYVLDLLNMTGRVKIVALPSVKGTVNITLYETTVEKALDAILKTHGYLSRSEGDYILVYSHEDLDLLDPQASKIEILTYKPQYIAANDLIQVLTPHLTEKGKISATKANQIGIATNADNAGGDSLAVDDAIVVQDIRIALDRVKKIIDEIDIRPQQVLMEAILLSVQLDDDHHLGVNFALLDHSQSNLAVFGNGSVINGAAGFPPSSLVSPTGKVQGAFATNEHGLKYGVINGDFTAFINLLETIGQTTVIASPKVLALNKQRAEIIVGSQLGYRTVTTTETAAVENVQFLDVGTQLRMRPFVQQDGYIRMELHPEKSSGKVSETTGLPEKDTTQVTTNLTVRSGETIVIGGLIQEQQQRSVQQIPYLGSLPLVGRLFRDETTTINRREIIVLITPTIINDEEEYARARCEMEEFAERRDSLENSLPPYTRPGLALKYMRLACRYRDAGDIESALVMVNLAVYMEPTNDQALELRRQLETTSSPRSNHIHEADEPLQLWPAGPQH